MFKTAAFGLAIATIAAPASALVYTLDITGHVATQGGQAGPEFSATFRVDTAKDPHDGITWTFRTGGTTVAYSPPTLLEKIPEAQYFLYRNYEWSYADAYDEQSFAIGRGHDYSDNVYDPGENFVDVYQHQLLSLEFYFEGVAGLFEPGSVVPKRKLLGPDAVLMGSFSSARAYNQSPFPNYRNGSFATLIGTGYSVSVPEPATWALMIIGFGATGATLRGRKGGTKDFPTDGGPSQRPR